MHLRHQYKMIRSRRVDLYNYYDTDLPVKRITECLLGCPCGKIKFTSIEGSWTTEDLRKARNEQ